MNKLDNLKPFDKMDKERQKEIASMGGKASGETKRRRKQLKENIELLFSLPVKSLKNKAQLESLGIKEEDMTNQMAMIIGIWNKALKGDVQAFNSLRDTIGEKEPEKIHINNVTPADELLKSIEELKKK